MRTENIQALSTVVKGYKNNLKTTEQTGQIQD